MKLTYDREADAAYLQIADSIAPGESAFQIQVPDDERVQGQFILDIDQRGRLLGVEVLFASQALPSSVLSTAELP